MKRRVMSFFVFLTAAAAADTRASQFLFGASVYPELQTRQEWNRMLDEFQKAHFNVVRVSESSWGNLETAPGQHNFGWLRQFLDDLDRRGMKAILGTSSYIAPQWLAAKHSEVLLQPQPGLRVHPMGRKAACLNHPEYREAVRRYVTALGRAFRDHPAVIGWQLDNEIENVLGRICYNPACEKAWHQWLHVRYGSAQEFNKRLNLVSWGMQVDSLDDVPQPGETIEGVRRLPALQLASLHFRRDVILNFFAEQTAALREAGVKQWITTDWNTNWNALADDPLVRKSLDLAGLNFYQPTREAPDPVTRRVGAPEFWTTLAWHLDMHRAAHGLGHFLVTETRLGATGSTAVVAPFPTREQFRMWMLQPAAFGASGLLYWTGNRWTGGHWPHFGGVLDWTGRPEPNFDWLVQTGEWFRNNSERLLRNPVKADAVVLTDFDQRATLSVYSHTSASQKVLVQTFDALHRLGIGADTMNFAEAAQPGKLAPYKLAVIPAASALDATAVVPALREFVSNGGHLVITPFTAYQHWDGVFRNDGFGANLRDLTGAVVRTAWRMGTSADPARSDQHVRWLKRLSPVGVDGYCEFLDLAQEAEAIGRFESDAPILNGQPAATRRKLGRGSVIKLAFWPADDSALRLFRDLAGDAAHPLAAPVPAGVQAVPRRDRSLFVINTSYKPAAIQLARGMTDRLSGRKLSGRVEMKGYEVFWLE